MVFLSKDINLLIKRLENKKVILTTGCFDIIHQGHIDLLQDAKKYGEVLVVGIHTDSYTKKHKGEGRPIFLQKIRARIIDALSPVDYVFCIPEGVVREKLPIEVVKIIKPSVYVTRRKEWKKFNNDFCSLGTSLVCLDTRKVNSSTRVIKKIKETK